MNRSPTLDEFTHECLATDVAGTRANVFEYIDRFYNLRRRRHLVLDYLNSIQFEENTATVTTGTVREVVATHRLT